MSFAFHAAPPHGEWFNDPNGLVFADGTWRLFVQHSAAEPEFREIGWARLSSPDLVHWTWDGPVIAPDALGQAYSGSVVESNDGLTAYLTRHDGECQRQVGLTSKDAGLSWRQGPPIGPAGRNVRDPFVFFCAKTGDWRMFVAEPCDWTTWAGQPPSTLSVWHQDGDEWRFAGRIGPWMEPGVMWEVPVLVDFGTCQALILSTVDRRRGGAECAVRYWLGQFDGTRFDRMTPEAGLLLDHGPDFYAAIVGSAMPATNDRALIAWASNWQTARAMPWPGGAHGGPLTLPRKLSLDPATKRLVLCPVSGIEPAGGWQWDGETPLTITIKGSDAELSLAFDRRELRVARYGMAGLLDWKCNAPYYFDTIGEQTISIYNDAGLIEVFIAPAGLTVTVFVPGAQP